MSPLLIQSVFGSLLIIIAIHLLLTSIAKKETFASLSSNDTIMPMPAPESKNFQSPCKRFPFDQAITEWNSNESEETFSNQELLNYIKKFQGKGPTVSGASEKIEPFETNSHNYYPMSSEEMSPFIKGAKVVGMAAPKNSYNELKQFKFPEEATDNSKYFDIEKQKVNKTSKGVPRGKLPEGGPIVGAIASDQNTLVDDRWTYMNPQKVSNRVTGNILDTKLPYAPFN